MKKSAFSFSFVLILICALLHRCIKEKDFVNPEQEISFAIDVPDAKNSSDAKGLSGYNLSDARKIILTIQNADGSPTKYSSSELKIYQNNGAFYSQKLILKTGSYRLTEFMIMDSAENVIFTTPLKGSSEAQNVANPLPIAFDVYKDISSPITVEVASTENKTPEDFGLVSFMVSEKKNIDLYITVTDKENDRLLSARLTVSGGNYLHVQMLDSTAGNRVTLIDSLGFISYIMTIEKDRYKTFSHVYTKDSLKLLGRNSKNSPLVITLEINDSIGTVTDLDNNIYRTIKIGDQWWMAENLKTTKYNDGEAIPYISSGYEWFNFRTPGYGWVDNNPARPYGAFYNWFTVITAKLCPSGWHVPEDSEWTTLTTYLGGIDIAGGKLKETGITHWYTPNAGATNESGFTALPAGEINHFPATPVSPYSRYLNASFMGFWWSITEDLAAPYSARIRGLINSGTTVIQGNYDKINGISVRCLKGEVKYLPLLTTTGITNITQTSVSTGGNISRDGGATVTTRGVCWSTSENPTIENDKTTDGSGMGTFTSSITGLTLNTTYHIRAYASNSEGTTYGNELIFKTYGESVTDIDGNNYNTVAIGNQVWLAENLKTTRYGNGDLVGTTNPPTLDLGEENTPEYQWPYNGDENNISVYGRLYTWYAVADSRNICPAGWHVPEDAEWTVLTDYLGGESVAGIKLKETGTIHWIASNSIATNESSFTALPGGYRDLNGTFSNLGGLGNWWTSTEINTYSSVNRRMSANTGSAAGTVDFNKKNGLSVRCIKDN